MNLADLHLADPSQSELYGDNVVIVNVRLPFKDKDQAKQTWMVQCTRGRVSKISLNESNRHPATVNSEPGILQNHLESSIDGRGGLLLPSFCHSHIHLDKCFILEQCGDLTTGDFTEAMRVTNAAKKEFPRKMQDLYGRGARLIRESVEHGVTAMRAHVEIDTSVGFACLEVAQKLQAEYHAQCDVQIAIFAQERFFDSSDDQLPGENFVLLKEAAMRHNIHVVGSAPYVEPSIETAKKNISLILDIADAQRINHVDFHLDYNLDPDSEPLIYEVIAQVRHRYGSTASSPEYIANNNGAIDPVSNDDRPKRCPHITIGHATRLQLFSAQEWRALAESIANIPITFVGLPQSDIYMQGRLSKDKPLGAPRGTLRVPYVTQNYGVEIAMSVNNVENAFTPQGSLDPLSLCTFGVGIFQAATPAEIRTLVYPTIPNFRIEYSFVEFFIQVCLVAAVVLGASKVTRASNPAIKDYIIHPHSADLYNFYQRAVTLTSKTAIGLKEVPRDLVASTGDQADFVILHGRETLQSAVLNPCFERTTIKGGRVVSYRRMVNWFLGD